MSFYAQVIPFSLVIQPGGMQFSFILGIRVIPACAITDPAFLEDPVPVKDIIAFPDLPKSLYSKAVFIEIIGAAIDRLPAFLQIRAVGTFIADLIP